MIAEQCVHERPVGLTAAHTHYCPGCTHGIAHRLTAEVLEELGILGRTIGVASVGCSVFAYHYIACDIVSAAHGRAPAVATGLKRVLPERIILRIRGMVIWHRLGWLRCCMLQRAARRLRSFSSTTRSMA